MMTAQKKKFLLLVAMIIFLWIMIGIIDFVRVHHFERPLFCLPYNTADDGGSGTYVGLGYSFEIKGNFMPEDELPGVTEYIGRIFHLPVMTGIRE